MVLEIFPFQETFRFFFTLFIFNMTKKIATHDPWPGKQLRMYYTVVGREEWWWVMDDSIDAIGAQLEKQGYCILDGFLTNEQVRYLGQPATGPR